MPNPHNYDERDPRNADPRDPRSGDPRSGGAPNRGPVIDDGGPNAGNYPVKVVSHSFGKAGTGTLQIGCMLEIAEGDHKGKTYPWYGSFTQDATAITIRGMRALGWQGDDLANVESMYKGVGIGVLEIDNDRDGNPRRRFSFVNGAGVAMKETMNASDLAAFAKQMRGTIARLPGGSAQGGSGGGDTRGPAPTGGGGGYYDQTRTPDRGPAPPPANNQRSFGGDNRGSGNGRPYDDAPPPSDNDRPPFERGRRA